ncbi:uncharacterized protein FIBRA_05789 [Fibroporia radiculosa]|uniref:Exosome complex protein n=1 Tax=Fibroporia radiculosa TaxID=599839 RepID=J4GRL8_9APHY|nr:uncharacterized protein FIBRA_05789 [Fibroporia radiculosa]CCM03645.1 predicted protein [Fibroporia radiculosa]
MAIDAQKVHAKLSALNASLDDLEAQLEPLFAQTLPETVVGLETVQQAKLQVTLPYLLYDLIFIYLRTRGLDPKSHPVIAELDRIRQYFDKIKNAEEPPKSTLVVCPSLRLAADQTRFQETVEIDKAAANRFIKHAIAQVKAQRPPGDTEGPSNVSGNKAIRVPVKVTSKMAARAQYEKELAEQGSDGEDDNLEVIDDVAEEDMRANIPTQDTKGKGKAVEYSTPETAPGRKRRRPPVDPFAGYGDEPEQLSQAVQPTQLTKAEAATTSISTPDNSGQSTPQLLTSDSAKDKKSAKKARKKAKKRESLG